jgi:hypothetical protein
MLAATYSIGFCRASSINVLGVFDVEAERGRNEKSRRPRCWPRATRRRVHGSGAALRAWPTPAAATTGHLPADYSNDAQGSVISNPHTLPKRCCRRIGPLRHDQLPTQKPTQTKSQPRLPHRRNAQLAVASPSGRAGAALTRYGESGAPSDCPYRNGPDQNAPSKAACRRRPARELPARRQPPGDADDP